MAEPKFGVDFGTIERSGLSDRVTERILTLISERQLKPGDRLPPERELATLMGVSRPIIREALRALSYMKVVENRQRAGTFITSLKPETLVEHLEFVFSLDDSTYLELLHARKVVEPGLAELAAQHITDDELQRLEELDERSTSLLNDPEAFLQTDLELHGIITKAARNMVLSRFMTSIVKISIHSRRRTNTFVDVRRHTVNDHHRIVSALRAHDPQAARQAMFDHLAAIEDRLLKAAEAAKQAGEGDADDGAGREGEDGHQEVDGGYGGGQPSDGALGAAPAGAA